jgi:hypothetical protein
VLLNSQAKAVEFAIPAGEWKIFGDGRRAGNSELRQSAAKLSGERATGAARSALILGELKNAKVERDESKRLYEPTAPAVA